MIATLAAFLWIPSTQASEIMRAKLNHFENRIRPVLAESCTECHGSKKAESGLRLDSREAILQGGDSGPAVRLDAPESSLLIQALKHQGDLRMPKKQQKLSTETIRGFVRWIQDGLLWQQDETANPPAPRLRSGAVTEDERGFWSFLPIQDPAVPVTKTPWAKNNIDRFIHHRLRQQGLAPQGAADQRILIRRATFDLTGLPPTKKAIESFLADSSPTAFQRVVERLLSAEAYGERWGRHWLDVVRYADTAGETGDYPTPLSYKYRNWVIDAFNQDQPYDEFIRDQIAGDLIALQESPTQWNKPTRSQFQKHLTATGYIAISRRFGFNIEGYHHLTIQDTIDNIGQAILGLTLGCARCHDHKYDPITKEDYYAWYGILESTRYSFPGSEEKKRSADLIPALPEAESAHRKAEHEQKTAQLEKEIQGIERELTKVREAMGWNAQIEPRLLPHSETNRDGHEGFSVWHGNPLPMIGINTSGKTLEVPGTVRPKEVVVHPAEREGLGIGWRSPVSGTVQISGRAADAHQCGNGITWHLDLLHSSGFRPLRAGEIDQGGAQSFAPETETAPFEVTLRRGDMLQLAILPRGNYGCDLTQISFQIRAKAENRVWSLERDLLEQPLESNPRVDRPDQRPVWYVFSVPEDRGESWSNPAATELTVDQRAQLPIQEARLKSTLARRREQWERHQQAGPYELVYGAVEGPRPQDARLQIRGQKDRLGEQVPRRNLELLGKHPIADPTTSGRRDLANWLTDTTNPLTARVMVNRIWQQHFGRGLVASANDFGVRGDRPTHPDLLDWLASRFIESGWSVKAMHRLIMASATYQQASGYHPVHAEMDPEASYLWRFHRRRLSAEEIRDAMLWVSGELDPTRGEQHPFPDEDTWGFSQHAPFYGEYPTEKRSIYLMQQRLKRHPYLALFDGADPNVPTAQRELTTVPTQSLYLMNSEFVHARALALGRRVQSEGSDDEARVDFAFSHVLGRPATELDQEQAARFLSTYRKALQADSSDRSQPSAKLWAAFARSLLTRNEFLFID